MNQHFKMMLRLILIVLFVHISGAILSQDSDSLKCWSRTNKLKWDDFKGKVPYDGDRSYLSAVSSLRLIPIRTNKNNLLSYYIKVVFRKYDSWTIDTAKHLLSHEQLHFDLAELTARKLRKAIQGVSEINQNPTEEDFNSVIQKLYIESANMDAMYDKETIHGIDRKSQLEWQQKVCLELKKLEKYASTPTDCQLP